MATESIAHPFIQRTSRKGYKKWVLQIGPAEICNRHANLQDLGFHPPPWQQSDKSAMSARQNVDVIFRHPMSSSLGGSFLFHPPTLLGLLNRLGLDAGQLGIDEDASAELAGNDLLV